MRATTSRGASRVHALALLTAALLALPACRAKNDYIADRSGDFTDILRAKVMAGDGAALKVDVFQLLQFGAYEMWNTRAAGIHDRTADRWSEDVSSWGLAVGFYEERVEGIERFSGNYGWDFSDDFGLRFGRPDNPVDFASVRVTLALFLGVDVELRLGELFDFVVGIATFDPAGDDRKNRG